MNQWDESEALGLLIQGERARTVNLESVELVFKGDRFNLSPLASTLASSADGLLTRAAVDVFNIPRKFTQKKKAYNKEKVDAETVVKHLEGLMDVSQTSATVVAHLVKGADGFLLSVNVEEEKRIELLLDNSGLDAMLEDWGCGRDDFWDANREKRELKFKSSKKSDKKVSRYMKGKKQRVKSSARSYTVLLENGKIFIKNWCIPIARQNDDDDGVKTFSKCGDVVITGFRSNRTSRIRAMQQDRNRYSVLPHEVVEYSK